VARGRDGPARGRARTRDRGGGTGTDAADPARAGPASGGSPLPAPPPERRSATPRSPSRRASPRPESRGNLANARSGVRRELARAAAPPGVDWTAYRGPSAPRSVRIAVWPPTLYARIPPMTQRVAGAVRP